MKDLLLEIGAEEIPAGYIPPALEQLERTVVAALAEARLAHGAARTWATPRRLALHVAEVAERQPDRDEEAQGPAAKVAWDAEGRPTGALLGFCRGKGVDVSAVRRVQTPKGEYVAVTVHQAGRPAAEVLPPLLAAAARGLQFPKAMRWLDDDTRFARPVRWLLALLGGDVLPVKAFGLEAGRATRGHRFLAPAALDLAHPGEYLEKLRAAFVLADHHERRATVKSQVAAVAAAVGGAVLPDEALVDVNTFMIEWPTAFAGSYDARFHDLPNEVIVSALREHQSFFTVAAPGSDGRVLLDKFVAVRNGGDRGLDVIRKGNEDVLTARLEDAEFYWKTDLRRPPAARVEDLDSVVWMEGLGSLRGKANRLVALSLWLAERSAADAGTLERAALLCKTDLLTEMIGSGKEYAGLQGVIGGHYARRAGEPEAVADAIYWHYHPRFAGDELPRTHEATVLSLADKLDHVAGAFVAGKVPSGSEDPYGVRRAANGVVRLLVEKQLHLDLAGASRAALANFADAPAGTPERLDAFWRDRVRAALEERGVRYDTCDAALAALPCGAYGEVPGWSDPGDALRRAQVMDEFRGDRRFEPLVILFKRVANILAKAPESIPERLDEARLAEPMERELAGALERARLRTEPLWRTADYEAILPALLEMEQVIHGFFDAVLVNAEDPPTRLNRLRLLSEVRALFVRGWDLSTLVVEGEKAR